jgi:hypothetical protein
LLNRQSRNPSNETIVRVNITHGLAQIQIRKPRCLTDAGLAIRSVWENSVQKAQDFTGYDFPEGYMLTQKPL